MQRLLRAWVIAYATNHINLGAQSPCSNCLVGTFATAKALHYCICYGLARLWKMFDGSNQVEIWLDLMFLALQTDSTRVLTMSIENCSWGLDGVTDSYHSLSHHGQRADQLSQLKIVEEYLMQNIARFMGRLKTTKQPDGSSLLDSTQILFGSGLGSGSRHTNQNLPLILAGGGWKHGQHLDGQREQPLCNLYLSMLQRMGAEQDYFNRSNSTLTGLV